MPITSACPGDGSRGSLPTGVVGRTPPTSAFPRSSSRRRRVSAAIPIASSSGGSSRLAFSYTPANESRLSYRRRAPTRRQGASATTPADPAASAPVDYTLTVSVSISAGVLSGDVRPFRGSTLPRRDVGLAAPRRSLGSAKPSRHPRVGHSSRFHVILLLRLQATRACCSLVLQVPTGGRRARPGPSLPPVSGTLSHRLPAAQGHSANGCHGY